MKSISSSGSWTLVQLTAISVLGLVAAPALLGGPRSATGSPAGELASGDLAWLAAALLLVVWLAVVAPGLSRALADALRQHLPTQPSRARADALRLDASRFAGWAAAAVCFLVAQATLRRPLITALGTQLAGGAADLIVPACSLGILLVVIWRLHGAARPLIEASTRNLLDVLLSAAGSGAQSDSTRSRAFSSTGGATTNPQPPPESGRPLSDSGRGSALNPEDATVGEIPAGSPVAAPPSTGETTRFGPADADRQAPLDQSTRDFAPPPPPNADAGPAVDADSTVMSTADEPASERTR